MSEVNPFGSGGPFEDLMRNLARLLTSQGPINWEIAKQIAQWAATGGEPDVNPDPLARVRIEELLRVAELNVAEATRLDVSIHGRLSARCVNPSEWALRTLQAWKDPLETLAGAVKIEGSGDADPTAGSGGSGGLGGLGGEPGTAGPASGDPMAQLFGNLPQVLGPLLFGMQTGSMVGQLASRAMGQYDLPVPRPPSDELLFVPAAIDGFARDWSLDPDDVRLWVCLREVANHAVLSRPHVRARLDELIGAYVKAFDPDPRALEERLGGLDPTDMAAIQSAFGNPETLLGELQSDEQRRLQVPLRAVLAAVVGYVDHVMNVAGRRLIASYGPITEALHRRRLEETGGTKILGQLLGVEVDAAAYEQGHAFVRGVAERAGEEGLVRLWHSAKELPTPAELNAPGLWLARIDLPDGP